MACKVIDDWDLLAWSVLHAAADLVEAHKAYAETLPHRRKPCLTRTAGGNTCFGEAMADVLEHQRTGYDDIPSDITDEQTEGWCENCRHNRRMVLERAARAAKRTGALRRLVTAVDRWQQAGRETPEGGGQE